MDIIQLNKFSELHNGEDIFFCKTDFLYEDLEKIKKSQNKVILITGNSDYPITDNFLKLIPKNLTKWYGQNILSNNTIFEPIPIGLENRFECLRPGHGIGYYDRVTEKEFLLSRNLNTSPTKGIYSNFDVFTNFSHRNEIKQKCLNSKFIDWDEPNLSLVDFFDKILDYKMVVCPAGNGIDTHRMWEVLYSGRIPITIKLGNYKIYELYDRFPIIVLDSINDLDNEELIQKKYSLIIEKKYNKEEMNYEYWAEEINKINKI